MKVYMASDHAGFELKSALIEHLKKAGHQVEDTGPFEANPADDYPDYVRPCAEAVVRWEGSFGIVLGKSGQGEAMCANRVAGARAAVYYGGTRTVIALAREHNDANILSLGAGFLTPGEAAEAADLFLATPFSGDERHIRRLEKF